MKQHAPQSAASTAAIRRDIIEHLTQAGFAVTLAPRLSEALATMQHTPGLLVILDLMDPEAGQQLVEDLRATEEGGRPPVLLVAPVERMPPERQLL
jgi:DNA-binding response OmpR family regulator